MAETPVNPGPLESLYEKEPVLDTLINAQPSLDRDILGKAYDYCVRAHGQQIRKSGEPFLQHPVEVAKILAAQHLGTAGVAAGLLHDVVEDSATPLEEIQKEFGEEVAQLVDGVTKITEIQKTDREERQAETFRKMLLSMTRDIRVILIKFADRLHNLRTLGFLPPDRIRSIAKETMEVYAPLAHRLGMAGIRSELEDLAFKHLHPKEYRELAAKVRESQEVRERYIRELVHPMRLRLQEEGVHAHVYGRSKHLYSIHRKMSHQHLPFDEIFDIFALRIITNSVRDCYIALGIVHSLWNPLPARLKDYIASPKSNMYQSIHTTVVGPDGKLLEVQIRTQQMHKVAEAGIAAHWIYKEGGRFSPSEEHVRWLAQIEEWQKDLSDSNEFLEFLKIDLFPAEIFVFTPKGDIVQLPKGATALDFAFAIHTDLGIHCISSKINGRIMPMNASLKSGCTVEIIRSETQQPNLEWLRYVRTSRAKSALRRWLSQEGKVRSRDLGAELIKREYQRLGISMAYPDWLAQAAKAVGVESTDQMLEMVGQGHLTSFDILHKLPVEQAGSGRFQSVRRLVEKIRPEVPIRIEGDENLMIRFARCCMPVPGEKIVGFRTRGRGLAVHSIRCPNAVLMASEKERCVAVDWNTRDKVHLKVRIEVIAKNRINLLSELTAAISTYHSSILNAHITTHEDVVHDAFIIEVVHLRQLKRILSALQKIKGVQKVVRGRVEGDDQYQDGETNAP